MFNYAQLFGGHWVFPFDSLIFSKQTDYNLVQILAHPEYGRTLFLNGEHQSSEADEWIYHECLVHPAAACLTDIPDEVLILGGGEGATAREVLRWNPGHIDMIDIDSELIRICQDQLPTWSEEAFQDNRLVLYFGDCVSKSFLLYKKYDLIIMDLPEPDGSDEQGYYARSYFENHIKRLLDPQGVLVLQAGSVHSVAAAGFRRLYKLICSLFNEVSVFFVPELRWAYIVCSDRYNFYPSLEIPDGLKYMNDSLAAHLIGAPLPNYLKWD